MIRSILIDDDQHARREAKLAAKRARYRRNRTVALRTRSRYYYAHKPQERARIEAWEARNLERRRAQSAIRSRRWRAKNPQRAKAVKQKYMKKHRGV